LWDIAVMESESGIKKRSHYVEKLQINFMNWVRTGIIFQVFQSVKLILCICMCVRARVIRKVY
jgi:hypothetical protein